MGDVDALRREHARHRLGKAPQRELAHGEGGGEGKALHAGGGAREQHGTVLAGQHAPHRLLAHQEGAEGADLDRALHVVRRQVDQRTADAIAGVVDHHVGRTVLGLHRLEETGDIG